MNLFERISMKIMGCFVGLYGLPALFIIPAFAAAFWFLPYQKYSYVAVESGQAWTFWFPNIRDVLLLPFPDPERVSGMLVAMDVFFVVWFFVIFWAFMPRYLRLNKVASKVVYVRTKDFVLQIIGIPVFYVAGLIIMFLYGGDQYAYSRSYTLPPGLSFALSLGVGWWLLTVTHLVFMKLLSGYVKIKKGD